MSAVTRQVTSVQPAPALVLSLLPIFILCVHAPSGCTSELRNGTSWRGGGGGVERRRDLCFVVHFRPCAPWTSYDC